MKTKDVAAGARMSQRTLNEIEQSDEPAAVPPSEAAVQRLVGFYEEEGVTFLPNNAQGVGIRIKLS
ncbi:MAG: hypothetical protein WDN31_13720 [Hyphomicrobium sp.]